MSDLPERQEQLRKTLQLQELYHGRFKEDESRRLLQHHNWNEGEAISFIQENEPTTVRQLIQRLSEGEIEGIKSDQDILRTINEGITQQTRQFSCESCDRFWWRNVPARKQVSKCHRCHVKYEPVPREREWGWAIFSCECGNEFSGYGQMRVTKSDCRRCGKFCYPSEMRPPSRRNRERRSRQQHHCDAPDCHGCGDPNDINDLEGTINATTIDPPDISPPPGDGGQGNSNGQSSSGREDGTTIYSRETVLEGPIDTGESYQVVVVGGNDHGSRPPGGYRGGNTRGRSRGYKKVCVSPESRRGKKKVIFASKRHVSTGSTVATFLDQDDLCSLDSYVTSLPVIRE